MSVQIKFSPVPSLSHSIISTIPSPFFYLLPSFYSPPPPSFRHLSLPSKQGITLTQPTVHIPLLFQKRKYKTAIFRFMCQSQKKYNQECAGTGGAGSARGGGRRSERRTGGKSSGFALEMCLGKMNSHYRRVRLSSVCLERR